MKRVSLVLLIILLFLVSAPFILPLKLAAQVKGEYSNDRVVVGFKGGIPGNLEARIQKHGGGSVISKNDGINFIVVSTGNPDIFIEGMSKDPDVGYAERDGVAYASFTPNDTYYSSQWGPADVYANVAWDTTTGSGSVIVAIIDTGVLYTHPDLQANIWTASDGTHGYDFVNSDNDPIDDNGHGTHCAGIVAAVIDNGLGVAGMSQSSIMAVKVLNRQGKGFLSDVASGITWAVDHGANIISMSLGGSTGTSTLQSAVAYAYGHNCLIVAAAGNDNGGPVEYPAMYDQVIAVSALDQGDTIASYSSVGSKIEVSAPGTSILSTYIQSNGNPTYAYASGTSMACPHVAGVAALVLTRNPSLTNINLRNILDMTAVDLGSIGKDSSYGYGKVNAAVAVQNALSAIKFTTSGIGSDVVGAILTIDSITYTYNQLQSLTFNWDPGSTHIVTALDPISAGPGKQYRWVSWTNGDGLSGTGSSTYTVPTSSQTVTVNFKTQYQISFALNPSGSGSTFPSGTNVWEDTGQLGVSATPGTEYTFSGWTSDTASITFANTVNPSITATIGGSGTITANFNAKPIVNYLSLYSITDHTWLNTGDTISAGKTLRIYYGISDSETPTADLTVKISYGPTGGSLTEQSATYFSTWNYFYYDWVIPSSTTLSLYDVKVEVSDGNGGSATLTTTGSFSVDSNPVINYLSLYSITDHTWLTEGDEISAGKTLRIYYGISDAETPTADLMVKISYGPTGESLTEKTATYFSTWDYFYYDWVIPSSATLSPYDIKVDVSTPDLRSTTSITPNVFKVVGGTPVINYLSLYSITDHTWLNTGDTISSGKTLRIYYGISDAETPTADLTVKISYGPSGGSLTEHSAMYFSTWNYFYYDWVIPGGAAAGHYDVKVDVSTPDLRSTSDTELNAFNLI